MAHSYSNGFETFWKLYPRKQGGSKLSAWEKWKSKVKPLFEGEVTDALKAQIDAGMFSTEKKWIPHGRTWINQQRWEDEIEPRKARSGATPVKGKYADIC